MTTETMAELFELLGTQAREQLFDVVSSSLLGREELAGAGDAGIHYAVR